MATNPTEYEFSLKDLSMTGFGSHSFKLEEETSISLSGQNETRVDRSSSNNTDNAWGINHQQIPLALQQNKDNYGITLITRPQLNLTDINCRQDRKFSRLLDTNTKSVNRIVRCLLDPRLAYNVQEDSEGGSDIDFGGQSVIECPLVDPRQAFIPFLTNNLISLSGFPDLRAPTYSGKEGPYKEAYSHIDGPTVDYTEYDVTGTWRNIVGDPISALAFNWIHYGSLVHEGVLKAYGDFIVNREIDYMTRIYRFILDPTRRYIQRMACTGASYPYALNIGGYYDYDNSKPYNEASQNIQIPFKCLGAIYEDDIIVRSFNDVVSYFHPEMYTVDHHIVAKPNTDVMIKIPPEQLYIFNHRGYPHIDPYTYELQWWVSKEYYESKLASFSTFSQSLADSLGF